MRRGLASAYYRTRRSMDLKIPHNALVFVGDGRRLCSCAPRRCEIPELRAERVFIDENPPTMSKALSGQPHQQGSRTGGRSAVEANRLHELEEHHFVRTVAAAMEGLSGSK